jgi:NAD(P)-dependent dehydrogenase (short-subunit alcohol dehydrogenase family)
VELSEASWDRQMAVNLRSMHLACKHAIPAMLQGGGGAIVNIGSIAGLRYLGVPYIAYSASKGAVTAFTRAVALQYADQGIRANSIAPGLMNTPMIVEPLAGAYAAGDVEKMIEARDRQCPMGHMGDAWDVAYAALFLLSDEAKYVTGTELVVDGGITAQIGT